jgi:hypothetical protein
MTEERSNRPEVSVIQIVGGALAALTAAVVASTLGVEGTIMGAAVGSVVATAGGAWYNYSLERTQKRLRNSAQLLVTSTRSRIRRVGPSVAAEEITAALTPPAAAESANDAQPAAGYHEMGAEPRETGPGRRRRRWVALAIGGVGAFLIAMAAITIFELATGQPLAATVGNKNVSGTTAVPHHQKDEQTPVPSPSPTDTSTPTPESSRTTTSTPTATPSGTGSPASPTSTPGAPTSPAAQTPTRPAESPGG